METNGRLDCNSALRYERRAGAGRAALLNWIFILLIGGAVATAAFAGTMSAVTDAAIGSAKTAVELAIGLIGHMAMWLGFMHVLRDAGVLASLSKAVGKVLSKIFTDVPAGHPAMAAMVMNIAANMMGLGNAATPFGLKAMKELDSLNRHRGVATDGMAMFLAINTSSVTIIPTTVIAMRASVGSSDVTGIIVPTLLATLCSTTVAICVAKLLQGRRVFAVDRYAQAKIDGDAEPEEAIEGLQDAEALAADTKTTTGWRRAVLPAFFAVLVAAVVLRFAGAAEGETVFTIVKEILSKWVLPVVIAGVALVGLARRVSVYESFVTGAKEGFGIAVMIIPYLVAILVAIGVFRASGAMDVLIAAVRPATDLAGMPAEALPMAFVRPLSGSGALGVLAETMKTYGPDSFIGYLVSVMSGSTETTFYVLAVYLGSVQVRAARHTVVACLAADFTGVVAALAIAHVFF